MFNNIFIFVKLVFIIGEVGDFIGDRDDDVDDLCFVFGVWIIGVIVFVFIKYLVIYRSML